MGLTLAVTCATVIYLYITHEFGYESHQKNLKNTYRVVSHYSTGGELSKRAGSHYPISTVLQNDFPEIQQSCMIQYMIDPTIRVPTNANFSPPTTYNISWAYVEPTYPDIFTVNWLEGNPGASLSEPNSAIITKSLATRLFGEDANVIGKELELNYGHLVTISAIIEDPPPTTEFDMDLLLSFNSLKGRQEAYDNQEWGFSMGALQAYVLLDDASAVISLQDKLKQVPSRYMKESWAQDLEFKLQPLSDMHYNTDYQVFVTPAVTRTYLLILGGVGIFLIIIASINYLNLNIALTIKNSKKTRIRKVLGGTGKYFLLQSLIESGLIAITSTGFGLCLARQLLVVLKDNIDFEQSIYLDMDFGLIIFIAVIIIVTGGLPAVFSALYQIRDEGTNGLMGSLAPSAWGRQARKGLVVVQFGIAQALMIATIVLVKQIDFINGKDLGFDKNQIVNVPMPEYDQATLDKLRDRLQKYPEIKSISFGTNPPTDPSFWYGEYDYHTDRSKTIITGHVKFVDEAYMNTYGLKIIAGTDFIHSDSLPQVIVNEEFVNKMGIEDPSLAVGKSVRAYGMNTVIMGVVKDFHAQSLHHEIPALILIKSGYYLQTAGIKIAPDNTKLALDHIKNEWTMIFREREFKYSFLEDTISDFYKADRDKSTLLQLFAGVAILVACLGMYGLVSFLAVQRIKEIGIRRVLGANIANILSLLSKEFLMLILIALIVATPMAYFGVEGWLEAFPYRVEVDLWMITSAGLASVVIALLTVSIRSFKAATANPVNAIRQE